MSASPSLAIPLTRTWEQLAADPNGPGAREDHTLTVDEAGATAYLFGGRDGATVFDDLWVLDLSTTTWRQLDVASPAPGGRFGHEAVWVPGRGLAVFAGQAGSTFFDDLWLFESATGGPGAWRLLPPGAGGAPIPRYGTCSAVDQRGRLWISHGFTEDGVRFADTHAYDFDAGTWTPQSPLEATPKERCLHACWWTSDNRLALYGGQTTGVAALGDLWFLTPGVGGERNTWAEAPVQDPVARQLPAVARIGAATIVIGGGSAEREPLADAWVIPDGSQAFEQVQLGADDAPAPRSGATLIHDAARGRLLLFGGIGDGAELEDLWALPLR